MSENSSVRFSRAPYTVMYQDLKGEMRSIRRVPPAKLHDALQTDVVTLTTRHNDAFDAGEDFVVKHINPRHPNTLQLVDGDGATAFVESFDIVMKDQVADRPGLEPRDQVHNNRYLTWP